MSARQRVIIRCRRHGPFKQYPHVHLSGSGCPRCAAEVFASRRRRSRDKFSEAAHAVHGDRYVYEDVVYERASAKVQIRCRVHGLFEQGAGHHLRGRGCPACGSAKQAEVLRHSLAEFIEAAHVVHGDKYGYEDVVYVRANAKVQIRCPVHGLFAQEPGVHLKGSGCRFCFFEQNTELKRKNTATFILEAVSVHGDDYGYGLTCYRANDEKVVIECRLHGPFRMTPSNHLNGQGCNKCGIELIRKARQKSAEHFLKDARRVHGKRYDYHEAAYTHSHVPVTIICRKHGRFEQTPSAHLQGQGCSRCHHFVSKPETEWLDWLVVSERSVRLPTQVRPIVVDGYDSDTRTAYLFHGDYWHGNPAVFPPDNMHLIKKKTYGELHRITLMEENWLRQAGYKVVSIWERDFKATRQGVAKSRGTRGRR